MHAKSVTEQLQQNSGLLHLFLVNVERIMACLKTTIQEIEERGELDTYLIALRFPGPERVFIDSIVHAGQTCTPFFENIHDAADWLVHEQERFQREQAKLDKEARFRASAIQAEKLARQRSERQVELASHLGIDAETLHKLQEGKEDAKTT